MTPIYTNIPSRLILQGGSRISVNEFGLDVRTKAYKALPSIAEDLANAQVGQPDSQFAGLECIGFEIIDGDVMSQVILSYKGLVRGVIKPPRAFNSVPLQTTSVLDNEGESVSVMYYAPQTTWRWASTVRPTTPTYDTVMSAGVVITPFNPNPYRLISDLEYQNVVRVTNFQSVQSGNRYWENESTASVMLEPLAAP